MVAAGCGGGDDSEPAPQASAEQRVLDTVTGFWEAVAGGDAEAACATLTEHGRSTAVRLAENETVASCEQALELFGEAVEDNGPPRGVGGSWTLDDVSIDGELAQVQCEFRGAMLLRRSGDDWLIRIPACND